MKTYVIILSKTFPKGHPKAGENTYFKEQVQNALLNNAGVSACDCCEYKTRDCDSCGHKASNFRGKIHTIRDNYELWANRIKEVLNGKAILSIRQWSGKPYRSKQEVICDLSAKDEIGIQPLDFDFPFALKVGSEFLNMQDNERLANNDGLTYDDFDKWIDVEHASGIKAIILFTNFRYTWDKKGRLL